MATYIWQLPEWPNWTFDAARLAAPLASVCYAQGRLLGRMESLGFKLRDEAWLQTLTQDVLKTSEIEGERLDTGQVRSSIARRLGLDVGALAPVDRHVEGIVEVMLDATQHFNQPLTAQRLFAWHGALFPTGRSGLVEIRVAAWRDDATGPMQVISGPIARERVHYTAPPADRLDGEIKQFLHWFEQHSNQLDDVIKAGLAHLWMVTLHPFDDGNGRIARAVGDMALARSEQVPQRFYSLSAQLQQERSDYYDILERTQKGSLDVTEWLLWFLACLQRAIARAEDTLSGVLMKARFWERFARKPMNERQVKVLNLLLDGFDGKLTTSKWAKLARCSQDTAYRDILALIALGALVKAAEAGRSTHYELVISIAPPLENAR
ncbi:MAG: cell filamentation protein Fic [Hydrogenophilales bacterium 17-61-9]|nr:MAG: cell filamentation protein Fic [Hydrogenophilales bacterium 17-61-9]